MQVALGIDTGGTYTDAALVDHRSGTVLAGAKALTTPHDLSIGIVGALDAAFAEATDNGQALSPAQVDLVGLSTTLATNAIVEDQGAPVCLMLIGYDSSLIQSRGLARQLVTDDLVYVRGGHNGEGDEVAPLDEDAVRRAVLERRDRVEAFAVSGYFGVRNPAHELRVRQLVTELTGLPVTCGHELTSQLDSVRRATTTALNARLIPLLRRLIDTVRRTLKIRGIAAPLMIVKGDGSLVQADWAMQRPIETILSGPAASVVGAWQLAGRRDGWVIDVGGTTTDIAVLRGGLPRLNPQGARIGRWRTMIETVDVHTAGLGGDSHVRYDAEYSRLCIGPRRAVPICRLASAHPGVIEELQRQLTARQHLPLTGQFIMGQRRTGPAFLPGDRELLEHLDSAPRSLVYLAATLSSGLLVVRRLDLLENLQYLQRAGFTPTDALHVLGRLAIWNPEASRLAAELLAAQVGLEAQELCEQIVDQFSRRLSAELVGKVLSDEGVLCSWGETPAAAALLERALGRHAESPLGCRLTLSEPIMAVGAPVEAYLPAVAAHLHTELTIPPHAGVGNAVGAVVNGVVQRLRVLIRPHEPFFRFHLPDRVCDFDDLESGIAHARQAAAAHLQELACQAGAAQVEVQMVREDRLAPDGYGGSGEIFVEAELIFTAVGGPGLKAPAIRRS